MRQASTVACESDGASTSSLPDTAPSLRLIVGRWRSSPGSAALSSPLIIPAPLNIRPRICRPRRRLGGQSKALRFRLQQQRPLSASPCTKYASLFALPLLLRPCPSDEPKWNSRGLKWTNGFKFPQRHPGPTMFLHPGGDHFWSARRSKVAVPAIYSVGSEHR
jgi:hypothetical protein